MKLIDKDKITAELEKRRKSNSKNKLNLPAAFEDNYLLSLLDTLETKEVDLEKEFYDFLDTLIGKDNGHLSEDELFRIAEYFYERGLNTRKE